MNLATYQASFMAALWDSAQDTPLTAQPGFAVYRNTVTKGCIDALAANYPAVERFVGVEWFRAAAADYVHASPPTRASLLDYGAGFADFLLRFPPAADLPLLAPLARLDRHWTEAHLARDATPTDPAALTRVDAAALAQLRLVPHPSARWLWVDDTPVFSVWRLNRGCAPMPADGLASVRWTGEGALTTRRDDTVETLGLPRAGCVLLDACAAGEGFTGAVGAALAEDPTLDLPALVATLLRAGAFLNPTPPTVQGDL